MTDVPCKHGRYVCAECFARDDDGEDDGMPTNEEEFRCAVCGRRVFWAIPRGWIHWHNDANTDHDAWVRADNR